MKTSNIFFFMKRGYKLVNECSNGEIRSYNVGGYDDRSFQYGIGIPTYRPKGFGPMCVLTSKEEGIHIAHYNDNIKLYECEYEPSDDVMLYTPRGSGLTIYQIRVVFRIFKSTELADKVVLTKKIS